MTRLVSTTLQGSDLAELEPGAAIASATIRKAWADTALLWDMLTGQNSPPSTINHTGDGRGCPPGGQIFAYSPEISFDMSSALSSTIDTYVTLCVAYVPRGEPELVYEVGFTDARGNFIDTPILKEVRVFAYSSFTNTATPAETRPLSRSAPGVYSARLTTLTPGQLYVFVFVTSGVPATVLNTLVLNFVGLYVAEVGMPCTQPQMSPEVGYVAAMATAAGAGGATVASLIDTHSDRIGDDVPLSAHILDRLARNLAALEEYVTAWPAAGGSAYTLQSSASVSAFADGTKLGKASEPTYDHVLAAFACGGFRSDFTTLQGTWPNGSTYRYSAAANTFATMSKLPVFMKPGSGRNLRLSYLGVDLNSAGGTADVQVECFDSSGVSAGAVQTALTLSGKVWTGTLQSIPYHGGAINLVVIKVRSSKPKSNQLDHCPCSFCLYEVGT